MMDRRAFLPALAGIPLLLGAAPPPPLTVVDGVNIHKRLVFHCGGGVVPNGPILVQWFYAVGTSGNLTYHRYNGAGDPNTGWDPSSGNVIGNGWGSVRHAVGYDQDVIVAVTDDGYLHWYRYFGHGRRDPAASRENWHRNSGNIIGSGWRNIRKLLACTSAGGQPAAIYTIEQNGDLRWFRYLGEGAHDPTASRDWAPNTGNVIGNGWQNIRLAHGSGNVIFAVDENGALRWYSYRGNGESNRAATEGWHANSGNIIGNGWGDVWQLFGGYTADVGDSRRGHILFAVTNSGELRWYRYSGNGENDPNGARGWHQRSGSVIAQGW